MAQERRLVVLDTADDVAYQAATEFEVRARAAIEDHGRFNAALSGGTTPRAFFALLAPPQFAEDIDWPNIHIFWGDERCVPPTDEASNYAQAEKLLLGPLQVPRANVHRMRGELEPHAGAVSYADELRASFGDSISLDAIYLGLGEDGHTASLFPRNPVLDIVDQPCAAVHVPENRAAPWRLTLTYPVLDAADAAIFLVAGAAKAAVLARVLEGPRDAHALPAQGVAPAQGSLIWLVDDAAASGLKSRV